jgi:hypothetical protein
VLKGIDIDSVVIHKSFAYSKSNRIYIEDISRYRDDQLNGYQFYVVMSGLYSDGTLFQRMECKISQDNYKFYKKKYYLTDYTK